MQQNPGSTPLLTQETTATFLFPKATTLKISAYFCVQDLR